MNSQDDQREVSGAQRILQSALDLFGRHGVKGTSLKAIAQAAGVSPALILHHYGSKADLRTACDGYATETIRSAKTDAVAGGPHLSPLMVLGSYEEHRPVLRYLARTLTDGSPHVNDMIDQMLSDADEYAAEAERVGLLKPSADPRARNAVLLIWSLGGLVLNDHMKRLVGVDLIDGDGPPLDYYRAVLEIYSDGVLAEGAYQELRDFSEDSGHGAGEHGTEEHGTEEHGTEEGKR